MTATDTCKFIFKNSNTVVDFTFQFLVFFVFLLYYLCTLNWAICTLIWCVLSMSMTGQSWIYITDWDAIYLTYKRYYFIRFDYEWQPYPQYKSNSLNWKKSWCWNKMILKKKKLLMKNVKQRIKKDKLIIAMLYIFKQCY